MLVTGNKEVVLAEVKDQDTRLWLPGQNIIVKAEKIKIDETIHSGIHDVSS